MFQFPCAYFMKQYNRQHYDMRYMEIGIFITVLHVYMYACMCAYVMCIHIYMCVYKNLHIYKNLTATMTQKYLYRDARDLCGGGGERVARCKSQSLCWHIKLCNSLLYMHVRGLHIHFGATGVAHPLREFREEFSIDDRVHVVREAVKYPPVTKAHFVVDTPAHLDR